MLRSCVANPGRVCQYCCRWPGCSNTRITWRGAPGHQTGNVLLTGAGTVRVTDFGAASRTGNHGHVSWITLIASRSSCGRRSTTSDDVYGLGALAMTC